MVLRRVSDSIVEGSDRCFVGVNDLFVGGRDGRNHDAVESRIRNVCAIFDDLISKHKKLIDVFLDLPFVGAFRVIELM